MGKIIVKLNPSAYKNTNMSIWTVGTTNQLFMGGSETETKSSKK